jgi:hypothetical protein
VARFFASVLMKALTVACSPFAGKHKEAVKGECVQMGHSPSGKFVWPSESSDRALVVSFSCAILTVGADGTVATRDLDSTNRQLITSRAAQLFGNILNQHRPAHIHQKYFRQVHLPKRTEPS